MGTGPYRFVEFVTSQRVVGELFPGYWGPKPGFQRIVRASLPARAPAAPGGP
jgi:ABC-type transport system substrate-binding protein